MNSSSIKLPQAVITAAFGLCSAALDAGATVEQAASTAIRAIVDRSRRDQFVADTLPIAALDVDSIDLIALHEPRPAVYALISPALSCVRTDVRRQARCLYQPHDVDVVTPVITDAVAKNLLSLLRYARVSGSVSADKLLRRALSTAEKSLPDAGFEAPESQYQANWPELVALYSWTLAVILCSWFVGRT